MVDFKHVSVDIETNLEVLIKGILEFCDEDDFENIIERIDVETADWDFTNRVYEYFRQKHLEFLADHEIDETKYREEYCYDPSIYDNDDDYFVETEKGSGVEVYVSGDDEELEEPWTTNIAPEERIEDGALVLGDEEDVDVFSTETEH